MDELKALLHEMADNLASKIPHLHDAIDALGGAPPAPSVPEEPVPEEPVNPETAPQ